MTDVDVVTDVARAAAMLQPARLAILEQLDEPSSAAGLARRLDLPRQRLNYHLRELEQHGLVTLVEERKRGSVTERVYRRTGSSYAISTRALGAIGSAPERVRDRFSSAHQIAVAARAIDELARLRDGAEAAGQRLATFALESEVRFVDARARHAFAEELTAAVAELVSRYHDESAADGRAFRLYVGAYPRPKDDGSRAVAAPDSEPTSR